MLTWRVDVEIFESQSVTLSDKQIGHGSRVPPTNNMGLITVRERMPIV
jgi:hypothetical protein